MKIRFQGFFVTEISERKRYFKIVIDILITTWYFIIINMERYLYFDILNEMNFTIKHKGGIMIKD